MKKVLQKSLRRLHALLLLAVMFVVGGSAWAANFDAAPSPSNFTIGDINGDYTFTITGAGGQALTFQNTTLQLLKDGNVVAGSSVTVKSVSGDVVTVTVSGVNDAEDGEYEISIPYNSFMYKYMGFITQVTNSFSLPITLTSEGGGDQGGGDQGGGDQGGGDQGGGNSVTFSKDDVLSSASKNGIRITNSGGQSVFYAPQYAIFGYDTSLTVSSDANITRIEFEGTGLSDFNCNVAGWSAPDGVWTGSMKSVTFSGRAGGNGAYVSGITVTYQSSAPAGPVDWTVEYRGTTGSVTYNGNNPTEGKFAIEGDPEDELVEVGDVFGYTSSFRFDEANHKLIVTYTSVQNYELPEGVKVAHGNGNPVITAAQVGRTGFADDSHQNSFSAKWYTSVMSGTQYGVTNTADNLTFTVSQDGLTATLYGFESILNDQNNYGTIYLLLPEGALVDKDGAQNDAVEYGWSNRITIQNGGEYPVFVYNNDNEMLPPSGWGVTVNGQEITQPYGNEKVFSRDVLTANDVEVTAVDNFRYTKSVGSNVTVKYVNIYTVSVVGLSDPAEGGLTLAQTVGDYAQGTVLRQNDTFSRESGTLKVKLDGEESQRVDDRLIFNVIPVDCYDGEITFTAHGITVTYTLRTTDVEEFSPAVDTYNLDDRESGFSSFRVKFEENFAENVSISAGTELSNGMTLSCPAGVNKGTISANSGSPYLYINLTGGNVAGDYTVTIPEGTFRFVDSEGKQSVNAAVAETWHLNAATKFSVNSWDNISSETTENEFTTGGSLKKLASFKVSAPEDKTFASVTSPVTVEVTAGEEEPVEVSATAALVDGAAVFTLPEAYTEEGYIRVSVPERVITTSDDLTNKAFTANFTVRPYDYFNITVNPASESIHYGELSTIVITLPVGKTAATVGENIRLNGAATAVSSNVDGNVVTLTLDAPFPYSSSNYYEIPQGFIIDAEGNKNNAVYPWGINVVKQMEFVSATVGSENTTEHSVTVEEFSEVRIYFNEAMPDYVGSVPADFTLKKGEDPIAITGNSMWGATGYDSFIIRFAEITEAGTYTVHIDAGVFTSAEGNPNEEITFDIVVPVQVIFDGAATLTPAAGTIQSLQDFTLTAPAGVVFDEEKGLKNFTFDGNRTTATNVQFAQDGSSVSFSLTRQVTEDGDHTIVLPVGFVKTTDGKTNAEIEVTYEVGYPYYTLGNVTPYSGSEVMYLDALTIRKSYGAADFAEVTEPTVITLTVNEEDVAATYTAAAEQVVITLPTEISEADEYTIEIPAGVISAGGKTNEAKVLTYTVASNYALESYDPSTSDDLGALSYIVVAPARYDVEFDEVPANVTITVNGENVTASVVENDNELTLTFAEITKGGSYEVVIPAGTFNAGHGKGNAEFSRTYKVAAKIAISAAGWTSFCLDAPFKLADGFTPYYVSGTEENGVTLTLEEVKPVLEEQDEATINVKGGFPKSYGDYLTINVKNSNFTTGTYLNNHGIVTFSTEGTDAYIVSIDMRDNSYGSQTFGDDINPSTKYVGKTQNVVMDLNASWLQYVYVTLAVPGEDVVIPAGEGILIQGDQGPVSYTKLPAGTPTSVIENNMLVGKLAPQVVENDPANLYYKFNLNAQGDLDSVGFYWEADEGHTIHMAANKAYIIIPSSQQSNARFLINDFNEGPTAIDAVENADADAPIFNLQGKRVARESLTSGVYVQNGRKFIVK